jgi:hypothetical protein
MYDIRQFKPALYLLVILGITGFAIAAEEPALWVLSVGGVMLNVWLVRTNRFSPMPRWLSNGIVLLASAFVAQQVIRFAGTPILLIGQFLVLLQLIKLFEQRSNRDYVQLIVLSSLLMVAAAISTASLAFGLILAVYVYLALYCFLLFHLKVEADKAKAAQTLPSDKINEATLRQDQRYLPRSMRRLTALVAVISVASAVLVFLFFPRGSGAGMLGQLQLHPPEVLTGFSDDVQLNEVAKITQNMSPVATVQVWHGDKKVETGSLRLRGATVDRYGQGRNGEWQWQHTGKITEHPTPIEAEQTYQDPLLRGNDVDPPADGVWRQLISLEPIGAKSLFALAGIRSITPYRDLKFGYYDVDETMQRTENLNVPIRYEVVSNGELTPLRPPQLMFQPAQSRGGDFPDDIAISPEIVNFAKDPAVSGPFGAARQRTLIVTDHDEEIAQNIERYFKTHFSYTLDLTDSASKFVGKDPLAVFVTDPKNGGTRAGHCEYFAGAMTLACQSLGLQARMVVGFVTDEYNSVGGYFQVRQCHAHTWVEVLTKRGWVTFDPTSGRELNPNENRSVWQRIKHVFDWMEYKWANSVVAYDGSRRENLIQKVDNSLVRTAYRSSERFYRLKHWWRSLHILDQAEFWSISSKLIAGIITVMALIIVAAVAWYLIDQRRIRRRAARIGLGALPIPEQIRLAKQLGFFEDMIQVLGEHKIHRPRHLTPRDFSRGLTFLPTDAYESVEALTRIFYRVRYGNSRVQPAQQRRLSTAVDRLTESLKKRPT